LPAQAILLLFLRLEVSFATPTSRKANTTIHITRLEFKLGQQTVDDQASDIDDATAARTQALVRARAALEVRFCVLHPK
jgi:hypothetical protein